MKVSTIHKRTVQLDAEQPYKIATWAPGNEVQPLKKTCSCNRQLGQGSAQGTEASCGYLGPPLSDKIKL